MATTEFVANALVNWTGGGEGSATFTATEKSKLADIAERATRATVSTSTSVGTSLAVITVNGSAVTIRNAVQGLVFANTSTGVVNGSSTTAYLNLVANNAVQSSLRVVAGSNISLNVNNGVLTISSTNTEYGNAGEGSAGLLSAEDKTKLDGIEEGAQKNVVKSVRGSNDISARVGDVVLDYNAVGAAAKEHGNHVPALLADTQGLFLRCDNTWCSPTNMDEILEATTSNKGLMKPEHVQTLDQLSSRTTTLEDDVDNIFSALATISSNISTISSQITSINNQITNLNTSISDLSNDLDETEAALDVVMNLVTEEGGLVIPSSRKGGNIWISS